MTRILRLLLIATVALPLWQPTAAQEKDSHNKSEKKEINPDKIRGVNIWQPSNDRKPKVIEPVNNYLMTNICSGNASNQGVPFYGYNFDTQGCRSQMLYPSSYLSNLAVGDSIYALRFYATSSVPSGMGTSTVRIGLGKNTNQNSYYANNGGFNSATLTTVYEGTLETGYSILDITFSKPYVYEGGDLVIDARVTSASGYGSCYWSGVQTNRRQSIYSKNGSTNSGSGVTREYFLPEMRISYKRPSTADINPRNIVVKDSTFFANIEYKWPINSAAQNTSNLAEIATDPDQIIAMLREIYMNKTIPGNFKRGFNGLGQDEAYNDVNYGGVGSIVRGNGYQYLSNYTYSDSYGWNIPGTIKGSSAAAAYSENQGTFYYTYMDSTQYKPQEEGLTLVLIELTDDFKKENFTSTETDPYLKLRDYISKSVKSARIISQARRTGDGLASGTLFKIDCDKMNKFYLMAKGQERMIHNSAFAEYLYGNSTYYLLEEFSDNPCYIYNSNFYNRIDGFFDDKAVPPFYNMFEEFSPVASDAAAAKGDIYQDLVGMNSFGVEHDCMGVSYMGHGFLMYGEDSEAADCQDVRDMMFFIPDYRLLKFEGRDHDDEGYQKFNMYNLQHQPTIGLYVIRQNEITPTEQEEDYYMLNLNWVTNLDQFLPSEDQEFELLQVIIDEETGLEKYAPVYYMNAQGQYTDRDPSDPNAQVVDEANKVPIVLQFGPGAEKNYPSVYVKRQSSSQQVTYAIRGRDAADADGKHFLSLQISNRQSYIIPGTDPTELVSLIELAHYSRYNPQLEENCYSNRFKLSNNVGGLTRNNMSAAQANQNVFTFTRKTSSTDENPVTIATATVTNRTSAGGTITVVMQNQAEMTEFPKAKSGNGYAGYHANPGDGTTWTVNFTYGAGDYVNFGDFVICDNFIADVSGNTHPSQYIYEVNFNILPTTEHNFDLAHGSAFRVPIYKTASTINNAYTLINVKSDMDHSNVIEDINFGERVQYSSKTEILRNDVYRWTASEYRYIVDEVGENDAEQDLPPHGIAGNQGEGYTVTMNDVNGAYYYNGGTLPVSSGTAWAQFVDYYPKAVAKSEAQGEAYIYAPVVETFSVGKNVVGAQRTDYNTYGGPQQLTAVGVIDIDDPVYQISDYSWLKGNDRYAYYTVELPIKTDAVPTGYKIYMIRAWRVVDPSLLDEPLEAFASRKSGDYMFEQMLGPNEEGGEYQPGQHMKLGATQVAAQDINGDDIAGVYRGTFGARKVRTQGGDNDGVIEDLNMNFRVRLYFTPNTTASNAPGLKGAAPKAADSDKIYYIAEYTTPFTIKGGITTGLESLNARQVVGVKYYNVAGIESDTPFQGVNIMVTRYSDGSSTTTKILK